MKKKDIVIIIAIICMAIISWVIPRLFIGIEGDRLQITVDGVLYGTYPLSEEQEIQISDTNICIIQDGSVKMIDASCPDHLCMKQRSIDRSGGPVGLDTFAAAIGEDAGTIEDVYEPYLLQNGFLSRTPRGRIATEKAYHHLMLYSNIN